MWHNSKIFFIISRLQIKTELALPFARKDILYGGSVQNLKEYTEEANDDMATYIQNVTELRDVDESMSKFRRLFQLTLEMFDFSLLKCITFLVVCASGVFVFVGNLFTYFC